MSLMSEPALPHSVELTRLRYAAQLVNSTIGESEPGSVPNDDDPDVVE
jgi:hypothetical protein